MKRAITLSVAAACVASVAVVLAQDSQPSAAGRLAEKAKELRTTPERLEQLVAEGLGDPLVVEDGLAVGVRRDAAGQVQTVKVTTPQRVLGFNVRPEEGRPGLDYTGGGVAPDVPFASASDLDGDARIDQIIVRRAAHNGPKATILLRVGERFEPATGLGGRRFKLDADGRIVRFDLTTREWAEEM